MNIDDLLDSPRPLTDEQHAVLRDAGFPEDELTGKTQAYFSTHKKKASYKNHKQPALALQRDYLAHRDIDLRDRELSYGDCRKAIRKLAAIDGTDEKYLRFIASYEADKAARAERKRPSSEAGSGSSSEVVPVQVPKQVPNQRYDSSADVPQTDVDRVLADYFSAYEESYHTAPTDGVAARALIARHLGQRETNPAALSKAIRYYFTAYDATDASGKIWSKSIDRLLSDQQKHAFIFDACIQNGPGFNFALHDTAKKHGMTIKQAEAASKRGDIAVERGEDPEAAREEAVYMAADVEEHLNDSNAFRAFKKREELALLFRTMPPDAEYSRNAIRLMEAEFDLWERAA